MSRSESSRIAWLFKMAWRDSRGRRLLLILFTSSVVFGVAAIVAIQGLRENLKALIDEQTRTLLGADLVLQTRIERSQELLNFIERLPGKKVDEWRLRSMVSFPKTGGSRFVELRGISGPMPLYGKMETEPAGFGDSQAPNSGHAIVEQSLLLEYDLQVGDTLQLGTASFVIEAALIRIAGESEISGFFAPRIYIRLNDLQSTGLVQQGSIIRYRTAVAAEGDVLQSLLNQVEEAKEGLFLGNGVQVETVEERKERLQRILGNLLDFLNLISFAALLLGGTGIVGAVHVYLEGKRDTIAVIRCLGAPSATGTSIYAIQLGTFGLFGALMGALLGTGLQFIIPYFLKDFIPFEIDVRISALAVLSGFGYGWCVVLASTVLPLTQVRRITPLAAIRSSVAPPKSALRDPLYTLTLVGLAVLLFAFALLQARDWRLATGFIVFLAVITGTLSFIGFSLRALIRKSVSPKFPYPYRMALGNLYRPQNRTLLLIVILGTGFLMLNTLLLIRSALLEQIEVDLTLDVPNLILIDVQEDQRTAVTKVLDQMGHPAKDVLPIIMMRVQAIKGRPLEEWRQLPDSPVSDWVYSWEFRNTYRDHILDNATLAEGTFIGQFDGPEPYPVSLSENVLDDLGVGIGDSITWNVQGISIETVVSSIRDVSWKLGRQNFNIVFPLGTIEAAPTTYAISLYTPSRQQTTKLQRAFSKSFPNVSLVDLSLVFESIRDILNKAAFVIQFMAAFTIATGLMVLVGALFGTRYQRVKESVLLRTIGASRRFIRIVLSIEFILLGTVAGLAGLILSWILSSVLLQYVFNLPLQHPGLPTLILFLAMVAATWGAGWLTSRGIASHPPLVVLRKEI